jgi:hypothetical protein
VQLYLSGATCVSSCPGGTVGDVTTSMCRPCDTTCGTCAGPGDLDCTSCFPTTYRQLEGPAPSKCACAPGSVAACQGLSQAPVCIQHKSDMTCAPLLLCFDPTTPYGPYLYPFML